MEAEYVRAETVVVMQVRALLRPLRLLLLQFLQLLAATTEGSTTCGKGAVPGQWRRVTRCTMQ
jgi:hypothetical protein